MRRTANVGRERVARRRSRGATPATGQKTGQKDEDGASGQRRDELRARGIRGQKALVPGQGEAGRGGVLGRHQGLDPLREGEADLRVQRVDAVLAPWVV